MSGENVCIDDTQFDENWEYIEEAHRILIDAASLPRGKYRFRHFLRAALLLERFCEMEQLYGSYDDMQLMRHSKLP